MSFENINPIIDADEEKKLNVKEIKQDEIIDADKLGELNTNISEKKEFNPDENRGDIAV